jgi:hypothetical protein
MRRVDTVRLERAPRLADFAKWVTAAEPGLGWEEGTFLAAYGDNRRNVVDAAFEANPVAVAIHDLIMNEPDCRDGWTGTATELLGMLRSRVAETVQRSRFWPQTAQGIGNALERVAPLLRSKGVGIEKKHTGFRYITLFPIAR